MPRSPQSERGMFQAGHARVRDDYRVRTSIPCDEVFEKLGKMFVPTSSSPSDDEREISGQGRAGFKIRLDRFHKWGENLAFVVRAAARKKVATTMRGSNGRRFLLRSSGSGGCTS